MHYDGNCDASIILLIVNLLHNDVIISDFFSAYFVDNNMTRTAKKEEPGHIPQALFSNLYTRMVHTI